MRTKIKQFSKLGVLVLILFTQLFAFSACNKVKVDVYELIGEWKGSWVYNGVNITEYIDFKIDRTYSELIYRDNKLSSSETGAYTINGERVVLFHSGSSVQTEFTFTDGKLKNGSHDYTKISN